MCPLLDMINLLDYNSDPELTKMDPVKHKQNK